MLVLSEQFCLQLLELAGVNVYVVHSSYRSP
jgi:hypothetical protein